jgi:hypothetical protein
MGQSNSKDNLTKENLKAAELEVLKLSGLPLD